MFGFLFRSWVKKNEAALDDLLEKATAELDGLDDFWKEAEAKQRAANAAAEAYKAERAAEELRQKKEGLRQKKAAAAAEEASPERRLDTMLRALRPGMPLSALDKIAEASEDRYTAKSLRVQRLWTGGSGQHYAIDYNDAGVLSRVCFNGSTDDTRAVQMLGDIDKALAEVPGVTEAHDIESVQRPAYRALEVPSDTDAYTVIVWYNRGHFSSTMYISPEARNAAADALAAKEKPRAQGHVPFRDAAPDPRFALGEEGARLSAADADAALRAFARDHRNGPHDRKFLDIVEWLISDATPDDRHGLLSFNWGHGFELPLWIVRQPDTDIATVLRAFTLASPKHYVIALAEDKKQQTGGPLVTGFDFLVETGRRLANGRYKPRAGHAPIGYFPQALHLNRDDPAIAQAELLLIPSLVSNPIKGRNPETIYGAMPQEWGEYLS